jgi:hypothetical protein
MPKVNSASGVVPLRRSDHSGFTAKWPGAIAFLGHKTREGGLCAPMARACGATAAWNFGVRELAHAFDGGGHDGGVVHNNPTVIPPKAAASRSTP